MVTLGTRLNVVDNTRQPPVPRIGGWGITLGTATALVLGGVLFTPTGWTILSASPVLRPVLLGSLGILVLGTLDDFSPLTARIKLPAQVLIAAGVFWLGARVEVLSLPGGPIELGPTMSLVVTVVWLVALTNAFNLLDGADGVAAGSALFSATAIVIMSARVGNPAVGLATAGLAGALLGFLPFNYPPAKAFLGDSGSMVAGFMLAGFAIGGTTKGATLVAVAVPLAAFALPIFDTTTTVLRRFVAGQSVFQRDDRHVHHQLKKAGLSARQVTAVVYGASALFALTSMLFFNTNVRSYAVAIILVGGSIGLVVRFMRLHEINELARLAKLGVLRAKSVSLNVQLRYAAERFEATEDLKDIRDGLEVLFSSGEFDTVVFTVTSRIDISLPLMAWHISDGAFVEGWPERQPDEWEVKCPFEATEWWGEVRLRRRVGRSSLMLDLNLLLDLLQPALSAAARRLGHDQVFPSESV